MDVSAGRTLSSEVMPAPDGTVYGLAVISDDCFVSGCDDRACVVWQRAGATKDFTAVHNTLDHEGAVRAVTPIPAGAPGFPTGGFATACMDKMVRLYSLAVGGAVATLVHTLAGHALGVISLGWTADGHLISGGWDGIVRVWDIATAACLHVLEGHENGTCVLGLPNGDIAVGSTGRKDEHNRHVDYKIRIWRLHSGPGAPPAYVIAKTLTDHEQAVRDLALLPGGDGFVSVGNDGAVKLRAADGSVRVTFWNPVGPEGKPHSVFRCHVTAAGEVVTANEDQALRVYGADGSATSLALPGTSWCVSSLPGSGDIVTGCGQAGTSKRGHIYIFSAEAARVAEEFTRLAYERDLTPAAKAGAGGSSSSGGGGGGSGIKVTGPYGAREAYPGTKDGQYGFFAKPSGVVMVCAWSAEAHCWMDVGEMEGEGAGEGAGGEGGGGAGMQLDDGGGGGGAAWDYVCGVTAETRGGMRSLTLRFNEGDDPADAAAAFCAGNGIPADSQDKILEFILERKAERAAADPRRRAIAAYRHFPASALIDATAVDLKRVQAKLLENSAAAAASTDPAVAALALAGEGAEAGAWAAVVAVLEQVARYHSTAVPRAGVRLLAAKLLRWPLPLLLPAVDAARVLLLHADGAEALLQAYGGGDAGGDALLAVVSGHAVAAAGAGPAGRGVALTCGRLLANAFRHASVRAQLLRPAAAAQLLRAGGAVSALLQHDAAGVRGAGAAVLYNYAVALVAQRRQFLAEAAAAGAVGSGAATSADADAATARAALSLAVEGIVAAARAPAAEEEALYRLVVALATLAVMDPALAAAAKAPGGGAEAALAAAVAAVPTSAAVREAATELRGVLSAAAVP